MNFPRAAKLSLQDLEAGRSHSFEAYISAAEIDRFAALSGDYSPLHMDERFARSRGFEGRVVHGAFLTGLASRMVGMHLPGENCLLHSFQMKFAKPVICDSSIRITGTVDQLSIATRAAIIVFTITDSTSDETFATGKAIIGITEVKPQKSR
jgi:3-hydroxybutyryl-CoA dehydratase